MNASPRRGEPSGATQAGPSEIDMTTIITTQAAREAAPLLETRDEPATASSSDEELPSFRQRVSSFFSKGFPWRSGATPDGDAAAGSLQSDPGASSSGSVATVPVITEQADVEVGGEISPQSSGGGSPEGRGGGSTSATPVCLICLETLSHDDFASGRAISLGCKCRGDLAMRHRDCAQKWAQVKDDGRGGQPVCELCKHPVRNLPPLPPRPHLRHSAQAPSPTAEEAAYADQMALASFVPNTADLVLDCIRVTWVAMIVSILFFEASLGSALWTGLVAGGAYVLMVRVMYRHHFEAMRVMYMNEQAAGASPGEASANGGPREQGPPPPQVSINVV